MDRERSLCKGSWIRREQCVCDPFIQQQRPGVVDEEEEGRKKSEKGKSV